MQDRFVGHVTRFLVEHGYDPGGKNPTEELEKMRNREMVGE